MGIEDFVRIAHTGCETGCFLLFAGVHSVLKLPHFVRFLSSFPAKYRRRCYMGCYIFGIRSSLPHALFRRINHPAVHAPQPICKALAETHMARPIRNVGNSPVAIISYTFEGNKGNVLIPSNRATK